VQIRENLLIILELKTKKRRRTVGHGKVEIQDQDSHFPTAQNACGARKKTAVYTKHLTHLRDLLKEVANNIQIIVFTCRPDNYLTPAGGRHRTKKEDEQPPVRAVNLVQLIERCGAPSAS
jgi:hypothetical protein